MAQIKVKGIVIQQDPMGEKDKRLLVLTADMGKIPVLAKGAKSQSGRFAAPSQLFCYSSFVLDRGKTFYYIKEYEILESFYALRSNVDVLAYASIMLELSRGFSIDGEDNSDLVRLLLYGLHALEQKDADPYLIAQTFMLRLMSDSGFRPELDHCLRCGRRYDQTEGWHFREEEGGLVCPACMGTAQRSLRPGAIAAMRYMIDAPVQKVYKFTISDEIRQQIKQPIRSYTVMNLGMPLKSLAFAENVENMDLKTRPVIDN